MLSLPFLKIKNRVMRGGGRRILIKVNVLRSSGPIRVVVSEDTTVAEVIEIVLKTYAHERRFPVLGTKFGDFFLYVPNDGSKALDPKGLIGSYGVRNFMLGKKPSHVVETTRKSSCSWKSWFNKTLNLKVTPH
ncbi:hypothetical protein QVD17_18429 [Tagetes erecta]|uniref:DUF7054 domain-containing protein n=1 Tax=Tagetes erecta TaxID=13708 RepID=A0AAD8KHR4_TARER|nr:hypothetical protein QVD17_18429 [Tagetes erecta]